MALFLRFKRARQTVFLDCDKGEQLAQLKARLCAIVDAPVDGVRFLRPGELKALDEGRTVDDLGLENDQVVAFVFRAGDGDKWEEPSIGDAPAAAAAGAVAPAGEGAVGAAAAEAKRPEPAKVK